MHLSTHARNQIAKATPTARRGLPRFDWPGPVRRAAFTRIEILVVMVVLVTLAIMLLPTLARTKVDSRAFQCLNNVRELTRAWRAYCDDNQDTLPYAAEGFDELATAPSTWVTGTLDFSPAVPSNWDVTRDIHKSPLWKYCGTNAALWHCPSDPSFVTVGGVARPRVRSLAMNFFLGGFGGTDGGWGFGNTWKLYLKLNEIAPKPPSKLFVLLDMRHDSIDTGAFLPKMDGYSESSPNGSLYGFLDLPGAYHEGAGVFSYADGRAEIHRWLDRRTTPPLVGNGQINDSFISPHNPDIAWLQDHSTRPR